MLSNVASPVERLGKDHSIRRREEGAMSPWLARGLNSAGVLDIYGIIDEGEMRDICTKYDRRMEKDQVLDMYTNHGDRQRAGHVHGQGRKKWRAVSKRFLAKTKKNQFNARILRPFPLYTHMQVMNAQIIWDP